MRLNTRLSDGELDIIDRWDSAEQRLFRVPRYENDDWWVGCPTVGCAGKGLDRWADSGGRMHWQRRVLHNTAP